MDDDQTETLSLEVEAGNAKEVIQSVFETVSGEDVQRIRVEVEATDGFCLDSSEVIQNGVDEGVNFRLGSKSCSLAVLSYHLRDEDWLELDELREGCPMPLDEKFPKEKASGILWDLAERGVIEKKNHPEDGRLNVYRITEFGAKSVENLLDEKNVSAEEAIHRLDGD